MRAQNDIYCDQVATPLGSRAKTQAYARSHSAHEFRFWLTLATAAAGSWASMASTRAPWPSFVRPSRRPLRCC